MSRTAVAVLGLYAATVAFLVALLASLFVAPMTAVGALGVVSGTALIAAYAAQIAESTAVFLAPLVASLAAGVPFRLLAEFEPAVRSAAPGRVSIEALQAVGGVVGIAALVVIALPLLLHRDAWRRLENATTVEDSSIRDALDAFAAPAPNRLNARTIDDDDPALCVFDDGRTAEIAITTGAVDVLDDRERDAVVARELARVVDRQTVASFWATALALGAARVVDPVATEPYKARAHGKVRLPFWFVAPLKFVTAIAVLALVFVLPSFVLAEYVPLSGTAITLAYAVGTVLAGFGIPRAADRLRRMTTSRTLESDEHGAVLAGDATALAAALQALHDAARADCHGGVSDGNDREAHGADHGIDPEDDPLAAFESLVECPSGHVPLDDRLEALDDVADRLDDRDHARPTATQPGNASS